MKLHQNTSPVTISGAVTAPSQFNIAASKEAFKILSSGLYTNKIRAIIRELSCNAYDAHIAAGKGDTAFDMHLPTSFEPFFSIKGLWHWSGVYQRRMQKVQRCRPYTDYCWRQCAD